MALGVGPGGDQLFDAGGDEMDARQRGGEAGVAFVGDEHDAAGFGDQGVCAGQSCACAEEVIAQAAAGAGDHRGDVVGVEFLLQFVAEQRGDALAALVDGGHDEVAGAFAGELEEPLAEVGFDGADALRFEVVVEFDLLGDHRFAFDHQLDAAFAADFGDVVERVLRCFDLHDGCAGGFRVGAELGDVVVEPLQGVVLGLGELAAEVGEAGFGAALQPRHLFVAGDAPGALEVEQSAAQVWVGGGALVAGFEAGHEGAPVRMAAVRRLGPWTPMVRERSMSAVREGPVTKVA